MHALDNDSVRGLRYDIKTVLQEVGQLTKINTDSQSLVRVSNIMKSSSLNSTEVAMMILNDPFMNIFSTFLRSSKANPAWCTPMPRSANSGLKLSTRTSLFRS